MRGACKSVQTGLGSVNDDKCSYGSKDELGTLNRLSDDVVKQAAQEIRTGTRISLNWPLDAQRDLPMFGRQAFHKHVYHKPPRIGKSHILAQVLHN